MRRTWSLMPGLLFPLMIAAALPDNGVVKAQEASAHESEAKDSLRKLSVVGRAAVLDQFTVLTRALVLTGLVDTLRMDGPFTVFAPTDEAFLKLGKGTLAELFRPENKAKLAEILKFHVVPGRKLAGSLSAESRFKTVQGKTLTIAANDHGIAVNDATVIMADVLCRNGVIHVIDRVLTPSQDNVLDVAKSAGRFEKLLAAVKAAGLSDALAADGPFTVFAPTDEAFEKLGSRKLKSLLQPENKKRLAEILKYHVIPAKVTAKQAIIAGEAKTLQGSNVEAKIAEGRLEVSGSKVVATDIPASNGIIHVIDTVLIPPSR